MNSLRHFIAAFLFFAPLAAGAAGCDDDFHVEACDKLCDCLGTGDADCYDVCYNAVQGTGDPVGACNATVSASGASQCASECPGFAGAGSHDNCVGWRQTGECSGKGPREPENDKGCDRDIDSTRSGYCECRDRNEYFDCGHEYIKCDKICN